MKGIIIYSSKTGNTKRMAEEIFNTLHPHFDLEIQPMEEKVNWEHYDFALIGAWVDRGAPNPRALKFLQKIKVKKLGLFGTLGAMPDSEHGKKVTKRMEEILEDYESLGTYLLPGKVDPAMTKKLEGLLGKAVPKAIREKMITTSKNSRNPTDEEIKKMKTYFLEKFEIE